MANKPLGFPHGFFTNDNTPDAGRYWNRLATPPRPYVDVAEAMNVLPIGVRHEGLEIDVAGVVYWWPSDDHDLNKAPVARAVSAGVPRLIKDGRSALVRYPIGGSINVENAFNTGDKVTGKIRITLPRAYDNAMLTIKGIIKRSDLDFHETIPFTIGGYWSGNKTDNWRATEIATWKRDRVDLLELPVIFGYVETGAGANDYSPTIDIGTYLTEWSNYLYVVIDKIYISNSDSTGLDSNFQLEIADGYDMVGNLFKTFVIEGTRAIDDIRIGGRNLIANSNNLETQPNDLGQGIPERIDDGTQRPYFKVVADPGNTVSQYQYFNSFEIEIGAQYLLTAWLLAEEISAINFYATGGVLSQQNKVWTVGTNHWMQVEMSFTANGQDLILILISDKQVLYYRDFKLERGNKATDWTPAIEDIENFFTPITENQAGTHPAFSDQHALNLWLLANGGGDGGGGSSEIEGFPYGLY